MTESQFSKKIEKAKQLMNSSAEIEKANDTMTRSLCLPLPYWHFFCSGSLRFWLLYFSRFQESKLEVAADGKLLRVQDRDNLPLQFDLEKMTGGRLKLAELKDKVVFLILGNGVSALC